MWNPPKDEAGAHEVVSVYKGEETIIWYDNEGNQHVTTVEEYNDWDKEKK